MQAVVLLVIAVVSFAICAILGYVMIPILRKLKFGQNIREIGPTWHNNKSGTPTMGGVMIAAGTIAGMCAWFPLSFYFGLAESQLMLVKVLAGLSMAVAFGFIGFMDDYISVVKKRNMGLSEKQKLILQFLVAAAYLSSVYLAGGNSEMAMPFVGRVNLGIGYYVLAALIIVGMVNAVNFTDGIDGLNSSVTFFVLLIFSVIGGMRMFVGASALCVTGAAACMGFLLWNFFPAKVFMGDTGSLFLGGLVCAVAFALDLPFFLLAVGIVYICEILSVVIQVTYFKLSGGKRVFKMTPIHHHFEMLGWSEIKICAVFSLVTLAAGVITVLVIGLPI